MGDDTIVFFLGEFLRPFLVFLLVFLTGYTFWSRKEKVNLPPGPPNLPILGSLPWLGLDVREPLRKMAKTYGDVMTVYLGSRRTVMLNTYDVIKEAYVKQGHAFSGRPQDIFWIAEITEGMGVISTQGDFWREQRRFSHTVLRDMGMGRSMLEDKIQEELSFFRDRLRQLTATPLDPRYTVQTTVANVICNVVWGKRNEYDDPGFINYMKIMNRSFESLSESGVLSVLPFLRYLPGDLFHFKRLMADNSFMQDEFSRKINEHMGTLSGGEHKDYIDAYLFKMTEEKDKDNTTFTQEQLRHIVGDLFGAGTETTTNTLLWCVVYLLHHPQVALRVQEEIDTTVGRHRFPSMKDKQNMPYTEATIMEVQRISEIVPLGVPHCTLEDVELKGYTIPKGTTVMSNMYAVHRDERAWDNPDQFNPGRFIDENGKIDRKEQLIPFGIGKRSCLGEALARMELFLFFTTLYQNFTFTLPPSERLPSLVGHFSITHTPPDYKVIVKERH